MIEFSDISIGCRYTRPWLAEKWDYASHHAISRGVITPLGQRTIVLFVTRIKQKGTRSICSIAGSITLPSSTGEELNWRPSGFEQISRATSCSASSTTCLLLMTSPLINRSLVDSMLRRSIRSLQPAGCRGASEKKCHNGRLTLPGAPRSAPDALAHARASASQGSAASATRIAAYTTITASFESTRCPAAAARPCATSSAARPPRSAVPRARCSAARDRVRSRSAADP